MTMLDPLFLDALTYAAKYDRVFFKDILSEGIISSGAFAVTQSGSPAMSVSVAAGVAYINNDESALLGEYRVENDAAVTKSIAAADPSNPRIDRVILQMYDSTDISGAADKCDIEVLTGTPAGSPSAPAIPSNALSLATVAVAAGAATIVNANITDTRTAVSFQSGIYTFSAFPVTPSSAPTTNYQAANKKYVDDLVSTGIADKTRHINLTPGGAVIPATSGCGTTQVNGTYKSYITADFDKDADEWCFWTFVVPDQYDGGNCVFNVWCKSTATSGDVHFVIYTGDVADAATIDAALGTTIALTHKTVDGTAGDAFVATATADPGWTAGRLATIKLMRDISEDDAAADINVVLVEIEWEVT